MNMATTLYLRAKRILRDSHRWGVRRYRPKILRTFAHDEGAFTQGLAFHNGRIFESTGLDHRSSLRCLDADSGALLQQIAIPDDWAEGVAVDGEGRLLQLSWKRGVATIYSLESFERLGSYGYAGEGWGLTSAPGGFVMTDGSNVLQYRDERFDIRETKRVTNIGRRVGHLNDLAYADGHLFANIWYRDDILQICAKTGRIEAVADCSELRTLAAPKHPEHVLNGIAYRPDRGCFVLTGKCWRLFFEVSLETARTA